MSSSSLVVVRPPELEALPLEVDAVEGHGLRRLVDAPELEEGKVLVEVDLGRKCSLVASKSVTAAVPVSIASPKLSCFETL